MGYKITFSGAALTTAAAAASALTPATLTTTADDYFSAQTRNAIPSELRSDLAPSSVTTALNTTINFDKYENNAM